MTLRRPWIALYRLLLNLLPSDARSDAPDMVAALEEQLRNEPGAAAAIGTLLRAFRRLPQVLFLEWLDVARPRHRSRHASTLVPNVRFAVRSLRKSPTFTCAAVLLIGLGVGAATAVFAVVDQVLVRPLPYPEQERLVYLTNGSHNGPMLRALGDATAFDAWTAVLTYSAWMDFWGGDPGVVGSSIVLNDQPHTVVGVLSPDFVIPERLVGRDAQVFRPVNWDDPHLYDPGYHTHEVVARLAPGVGLTAAQDGVDRLAQAVEEAHPNSFRRPLVGSITVPLVPLRDHTVGQVRSGLLLLLASVGMLLLVACANVGLLFLARGLGRVREMSLRRALGAGLRALLAQLAVESLLVGVLGALVGLVLAQAILRAFAYWVGELPRGVGIHVDLRVFGFAILVAGSTALVFGLLPALHTSEAPTRATGSPGEIDTPAAARPTPLHMTHVEGPRAFSGLIASAG